MRRQQTGVAVLVELAALLYRRNRHDHLAQALIGHHDAVLDRVSGERALVDQGIEHRLARGRRIHGRRVERDIHAARHLALAVKLLALCLSILLLADRVAGDIGNRRRVLAHAVVTVDAEKGEGRHDQHQQQELHQALMGANEIEHV